MSLHTDGSPPAQVFGLQMGMSMVVGTPLLAGQVGQFVAQLLPGPCPVSPGLAITTQHFRKHCHPF
jgi:hypothetical protein